MYREDIENERETLDAHEMFFESQINDIDKYSENKEDLHAWFLLIAQPTEDLP